MPFEDFTIRGGRARFGFPTVTVMRSGGIALNKDAYDQIGNPAKIVLAFERETTRIGIRVGEASEAFSYPVRQVSVDSWWVPGRSFLRYHGITRESTEKYRAQMEDRYLTIDLNDKPVHQEHRGMRKGSPPDKDRSE